MMHEWNKEQAMKKKEEEEEEEEGKQGVAPEVNVTCVMTISSACICKHSLRQRYNQRRWQHQHQSYHLQQLHTGTGSKVCRPHF